MIRSLNITKKPGELEKNDIAMTTINIENELNTNNTVLSTVAYYIFNKKDATKNPWLFIVRSMS